MVTGGMTDPKGDRRLPPSKQPDPDMYLLAESMHGAGSPQAQRVMMYRESNIKQKKDMAKKLAGIGESSGEKK